MNQLDSDTLEDAVFVEPPVPNWTQAMEMVALANEAGKALDWRPLSIEAANALDDAWHKELKLTPSIPGML